MEKSQKTSNEKKKKGLRLPDKLADEFTQSSNCNHVVVNVSTKSDRKQSAYCVMCGDMITDADIIAQHNIKTIEDLKLGDLATKGRVPTPTSLDSTRSNKRQNISRTSSTSSMSSVASNVTCNNSCSFHSHKKIKYFCEDHQEIGCSVCVNVLHRGCERILFIKDEIQTSNWSEKVCQDTISALNAISEGFKNILDYTASSKQKLNVQVLEFRKTRDELRAHMERILNEFDERCERKINQYTRLVDQDMRANEDICKDMIKETEMNICALEETLNSKSADNTFIVTQKVLVQRERYGIALSSAIKNSQDIAIEFIPERNIHSIDELKRIGKIKISSHTYVFPESVISAVSKLPKPDMRSPRTSRDARSEPSCSLDSQFTCVAKYNVRLEGDKRTCENVDVVFLQDSRIAIVDMSNRKVKMFDSKFSQPCALILSSDPRGITTVSPQEIAITLPDEGKIQLVSTIKKLQVTRSILTAMPCYGITSFNQQLVVLCNDGFKRTAIQMLDLDGNVLKTLQLNKSGKALLRNPSNITLSVDGQQICVTDKGRLVNFDMNGEIIFENIDKEFDNAHGLTVDDSGRFYVCGRGSNNVHRVSADGTTKCVVLTDDDVIAPQAVCYQLGKRTMLLTCVGNDTVFLYKIAKL